MGKAKDINDSSIKTKELIKKNFELLLNETKKFEKIKVTEICKRANINRSTFYLHYDSIYDVAEEYEGSLIGELGIDDVKEFQTINDIYLFLDKINICLKKNEHAYRVLLNSTYPKLFLKKVSKSFKNNAKSLVKKLNNTKYDELQTSYFISFYTDGMVTQIINYFITNDNNMTLDEITNQSKKIAKLFFSNYFNS